MDRDAFLSRRRAEYWHLGVRHREVLLQRLMQQQGMAERPLLKDVIDDIIEIVQGARLYCPVLPLDVFGQTEVRYGRIEVTINSQIGKIPGIRDAAGVAYQTKWHESFHVADDMRVDSELATAHSLFLPGFEEERPRLIMCRRSLPAHGKGAEAAREFRVEQASRAAAIAKEDLARSEAFRQFEQLLAEGGELPLRAWALLYQSAEFIGINATALVDYLKQRGLFYIASRNGKRRIVANPRFGAWI